MGGSANTIAMIISLAPIRHIQRRELARHHIRPPPVPSPPLLRRGGGRRKRRSLALARCGCSRRSVALVRPQRRGSSRRCRRDFRRSRDSRIEEPGSLVRSDMRYAEHRDEVPNFGDVAHHRARPRAVVSDGRSPQNMGQSEPVGGNGRLAVRQVVKPARDAARPVSRPHEARVRGACASHDGKIGSPSH